MRSQHREMYIEIKISECLSRILSPPVTARGRWHARFGESVLSRVLVFTARQNQMLLLLFGLMLMSAWVNATLTEK